MEEKANLHFKVEDLAEARTFEEGFRGAWFRCKIKKKRKRRGKLEHGLEYYDFPDEKLEWIRLYQVGNDGMKHKELMLRPQYPPIYNETQMPHASEISEVSVIVDDGLWKVGDLVDWWANGCYWSGKISQLLGDDKAKIELHPQPRGEGDSYDIFLKDVRPSLDWSVECGWTLPTQEGDTGRPCARLIKPITQDTGGTSIQNSHNAAQEIDAVLPVQGSAASSARMSVTCSVSSNSAVSDEVKSKGAMEMQKHPVEKTVSKELENEKEKSTNTAERAAEDCKSSRSCWKTYRAGEGVALNSARSDTLEAAVMDLEEYVNKVKWLRRILQYGISSSDAERPKWEFVEHNPASQVPKTAESI